MNETAVGTKAFDRYRRSPNEKTTLARLIVGTIVIVAVWLATTLAAMFAGFYIQVTFPALLGQEPLTFADGGLLESFMATRVGFVTSLVTFAGIWLGVWIAMRGIHRERFGRLLGNSGSLSRSGFFRGLAAVLLTSVLVEIAMYAMSPGLAMGQLSLPLWLLFVLPVAFLGFLQTSSEELLFRGYLLRGLAYRFRSPLIWAVLPALAFTALHWNTAAPLVTNIAVFLSIGAFAAMLVLLVRATGNLGAAMGAHLGNNLANFVLISHDNALNSFALFKGAPLTALTGPDKAIPVVVISVVAVLLALLLLMHPRSPLKVPADMGRDEATNGANGRET